MFRILLFINMFLLVGCSISNTSTVDRLPLVIEDPKPLILEDYEWTVYVNDGKAYICLTSDGYASLSKNIQELKRYIIQQKDIIKHYRSYYVENVDTNQK